MGISLKTHKILWGRSGNQCAICKTPLVIDSLNPDDDPSIVGDEAHIVAREEGFTRGNYDSLTPEQRDNYSNLILLCKTHHKQIDDQPAQFTVECLHEVKRIHESEVRRNQSRADRDVLDDDIIYSGYIDEWQRFADLDNWLNTSSWLSADTPTLPQIWYNHQKEFLIWIIGRIWPHRYDLLKNALLNYKAVAQDLIIEFDKHIEFKSEDTNYLRTEKFYRIREYDEEKYHRLAKRYNLHVCLVNDLFFELTRAANYICDQVRDTLFRGYRLKEGALLVLRHSVGFELKTVHLRLEYQGDERIEEPYPGLKIFKKIRYETRDYALNPGEPELPSLDDVRD
jgi:hypothetical protein